VALPSYEKINQIRVAWTGFVGAPGVTTFYSDPAVAPPLTTIRSLFGDLTGFLPTGVTLTFPSSGDVLNPATGELVDNWAATPGAPVVGNLAGTQMRAQGFQIKWLTSFVADGRALKGRTFFVPVGASIFGSDGLLAVANQTTIKTAADKLTGPTVPFLLWHRPKYGPKPSGGGERPIVRNGGAAPILSSAVPREPVVLRSRRD
jgi:hypothetical protein